MSEFKQWCCSPLRDWQRLLESCANQHCLLCFDVGAKNWSMYLHKVCLCWRQVFVKCQNAVCYAERMRHTLHFLHNWVWMTDNQWGGFKKAQLWAASFMFSQLPSRGRERNVLLLRFASHNFVGDLRQRVLKFCLTVYVCVH